MGSKVKGSLRPMFKLGKRLCFPSAPSWWVAHTVQLAKSCQDWRPQSKILFPFSEDHNDDHTPPTTGDHVNWDPRNSYNKYAFPYCHDTHFHNQLYDFFNSQKRLGYTDTVTKMVAQSQLSTSSASAIEVGMPFDVITLLSCCGTKELVRSNGDRVEVESLRGKNIMVCCVFVPIFFNCTEACEMRALPYACSQAFSGDDYEVVMVPKMLRNWVDDRDAFNHFLSGFPSSNNWLAIPFSDTLPRDFVCKFLGLNNHPVYLLVDRNQKVLVYTWTYPPAKFGDFTFFDSEDFYLWWKNTSRCQLYSILDCKPSDFVYQQISSPGNDVDNKVQVLPISELKDKLVGLYLCKDGSFIRTLNLVHQECKARNLDFEIVLVYLPYNDEVDPQLFIDAMNHVLLHEFNVSTWWVLPFDDFKSRRIWQYCTAFVEDELFIVGPHDEFVEPFGKHVMSTFGFNAYPFTREHIIEKRYQELRALTLESLLIYGSQQDYVHDYVLRHHSISDRFNPLSSKEVPVEDLRGKTILIYVDHSQSLDLDLYFKLLYWYCYHKQHTANTGKGFDDFEVVFVDLDDDRGGDDDDDDASYDHILQMPWLLCPFDPYHSDFVMKNLWKDTINKDAGVAAFAEDGRILSIEAQDLLKSYGPNEIQSYNGLRNEVVQSVLGTFGQSGVDEVYIFEM